MVTLAEDFEQERDFLLKIGGALGYSKEQLLVVGIAAQPQALLNPQQHWVFTQDLERVRQAFLPQSFWFFGQMFHTLFSLRDAWSLCHTKGYYLKQVGDQGVICHFSPSLSKLHSCPQTKRLAWNNMQRLKRQL